jgi:Bacterial membrane protein YfhO
MVQAQSLQDLGSRGGRLGSYMDGDRDREGLADGARPQLSRGIGLRRVLPHAIGIAWVLGAAMLTLAPALHHGFSLGPYDILSRSGLTRASGVTVRNTVSGDQIAEMIPWSTQAWSQVHHGNVPLWNPLSGLGLPLAFNWQSAVFSLPSLIGYLFPLHLAYTVQILVTLVIAGTGAYALARVLGLGVIGCATAGTIYELSGSFMGWLGWPHAAVMSWAGWLFAVAILIVRGRHRARHVAAFAVLIALAVYSGEPEIFAILALSIVVFVSTILIVKFRRERNSEHPVRPLIDLSVAVVAGAALSAPLLLPGMQVLARSTRNSGTLFTATEVGRALPPHDLVHLLVQGYNGLPLAGNQVFGDAVYTDTAAYVGLIGIALAVLGIVRSWRRPATVGFVVVTLVTLAIVYAPPLQALFNHIPLVQTVDWHRDLMTAGLCLAILAGIGMDALVRTAERRSTQLLLAGLIVGGLLLLLLLWLVGTGGLSDFEVALRRDSLKWPLVTGGLALVVLAALAAWTSRGRTSRSHGSDGGGSHIRPGAARGDTSKESRTKRFRRPTAGQVTAALLLLLETAFLVASGAQIWSSSPEGTEAAPAVVSLARAVGGSTVGFGSFTCYAGPGLSSLGILPESNILFGIHEFDFYDPVLPRGYVQSWADLSRSTPDVPIYNSFCPAVTTAGQARRYGIKFVLEPMGVSGPKGAVFDERVGDEDLYRIPGSADAVLTPEGRGGQLPPADASGTPVAVGHPSPSSLRISTSSRSEQVLRLRVTDEPGWHATIDGRPLQLEPFSGVMFQARIPAGHHVIELHYWPTLFTVGLFVAGASVVLFFLFVTISFLRRRDSAGSER